jgi:hypothetical protein
LYSSPSIIRIMKSRRMRWAGNVARIGGEEDVGGWIILGWILERWDGVVWTGLVWLRLGTGGELL